MSAPPDHTSGHPFDPDRHHRRSIRLQGYDYAQAGAYFITICTHNRRCLFGGIVDGGMRANALGHIVAEEWVKSAQIRAEIELDEWVVMPNHFHAIVVIVDDLHRTGDADHRTGDDALLRTGDDALLRTGDDALLRTGDRPVAPTTPGDDLPRTGDRPVAPAAPRGPTPKSIGALMAGFKSAVTTRINRVRQTPGAPLWQRNYWEHIIRNDLELNRIREYIRDNPTRWEADTLYERPTTGE